MRPQEMTAPILGMIMPERKVPNFYTPTRVPPLGAATDAVAMSIPNRKSCANAGFFVFLTGVS